jgi:transcriptional regulator with XRE-family HTH domain
MVALTMLLSKEFVMKRDVKTIRTALGLRQLDLALRAGCGISTISLIERGYSARVSPELREKIARALNCEVRDIFPKNQTCRGFRGKGGKVIEGIDPRPCQAKGKGRGR